MAKVKVPLSESVLAIWIAEQIEEFINSTIDDPMLLTLQDFQEFLRSKYGQNQAS